MSEMPISNLQQAGVYYLPTARLNAIERAAEQIHFVQRHLEITPDMDIASVLTRLGKVLHFPDWYGANFDALHDCLTDSECLPGKRHILTIAGCQHLLANAPDDLGTLLDVLAAAIDNLRKTGVALWVLVDKPLPGIGKFPTK